MLGAALAFHRILHVSTHSLCYELYFRTVSGLNNSHDKYQNRATTTFASPCGISIDLNTDFFLLCFWLLTEESVRKFPFGAYQKYVLTLTLSMQKKYKVLMINSISLVHRLKQKGKVGGHCLIFEGMGVQKTTLGFFRTCCQHCLYFCSDMPFTVSLPHWRKEYLWIKQSSWALCIYIKSINRNETKLNSDIC